MVLNFAGSFDPLSASAASAASAASTATETSRFFGAMVAWLFIVINGELLIIVALVERFRTFPVGPEPFASLREMQPQRWASGICDTGRWIALPLVTMLLYMNRVLGGISRVAPQVNIFAIGLSLSTTVMICSAGACSSGRRS